MKAYCSLLLLFLSIMKSSVNCLGKKIPEWCWTIPNLDAKVKEGVFGINWAVCEG